MRDIMVRASVVRENQTLSVRRLQYFPPSDLIPTPPIRLSLRLEKPHQRPHNPRIQIARLAILVLIPILLPAILIPMRQKVAPEVRRNLRPQALLQRHVALLLLVHVVIVVPDAETEVVLALEIRRAVVADVVEEAFAHVHFGLVGDPARGVDVLDPDEAREGFGRGEQDGAVEVGAEAGRLGGEGCADELVELPVSLLAGWGAVAGVGASRAFAGAGFGADEAWRSGGRGLGWV
jgi:hypothetical protein